MPRKNTRPAARKEKQKRLARMSEKKRKRSPNQRELAAIDMRQNAALAALAQHILSSDDFKDD